MKSDLSDQQKSHASGPPATDDLTIAENLRVWRQEGSDSGKDVYFDGTHPAFRIPVGRAKQFIEEFGPLHPGDYKEQVGRDWREDFAQLANG